MFLLFKTNRWLLVSNGHDVQFWKQKEVSLAYKWHTICFEKEEEMPPPEYERRVKSLKRNLIRGKLDSYMPLKVRASHFGGVLV